MNHRTWIGLTLLLSVVILILAIAYRGERISQKQSKEEKREYLKTIDSLGTANRLHEWDAKRSKDLLKKSEAEKDKLYHASEKREAVLQFKITNLTKAQAAALIPKDTLLAGALILKGLEYDSLRKDYDQLSVLMQFREIEFKNVIVNQDSLILNLKYQITLNEQRMEGLEKENKILKKKSRARVWQRNIAILGGVAVLILVGR